MYPVGSANFGPGIDHCWNEFFDPALADNFTFLSQLIDLLRGVVDATPAGYLRSPAPDRDQKSPGGRFLACQQMTNKLSSRLGQPSPGLIWTEP